MCKQTKATIGHTNIDPIPAVASITGISAVTSSQAGLLKYEYEHGHQGGAIDYMAA